MALRNKKILLLAICINLFFGNVIVFRVILQPNLSAHTAEFCAQHIFPGMMVKLIPISIISILLLITNARYFLKEQDKIKRIVSTIITAYAIPICCFWMIIFFILIVDSSGGILNIILMGLILSFLFATIGCIFWGPFALINYLIFSKLVPPSK